METLHIACLYLFDLRLFCARFKLDLLLFDSQR